MKRNRIWLSVGVLFVLINLGLAIYDYTQGFGATLWGSKLAIAAFGAACVAGLIYAQRKYDAGVEALKAAGLSDDGIARILKENDTEAAIKRELEMIGQKHAR